MKSQKITGNYEDYDEDYFERGLSSGKSGYDNYRWLPELTIKFAYKIIKELNLREGDRVLDYGCAKGFFVKALRILDIRFPKKFIDSFPGPKYGVEGLRNLLGHFDDSDDKQRRNMPIMGTVPKPKVGRTAAQQAELARVMWTAGDQTYDFIKDDENLTSLPFNNFYDRTKLILQTRREIEAIAPRSTVIIFVRRMAISIIWVRFSTEKSFSWPGEIR